MEKQAACAAPRSSSGVVVELEPSDRAFQSTSRVAAFDESRDTEPDPSKRDPFQTVVASLVTAMVSSRVVAGGSRLGNGRHRPFDQSLTP
jgi:hypothetical protein